MVEDFDPGTIQDEALRQVVMSLQPHQKASKQAQIRIDRVEVLKVDHERLPQDAQFKGYEEIIVQDIHFIFKCQGIRMGS